MTKIILISAIIFVLGCTKNRIEYKIIEDKQILKELLKDTQSKHNNKHCRWEYGYFKEYHLFSLSCVPKIEPSSFYTIEKRYKIKKKLLDIDDFWFSSGGKVKIRMNENEMDMLGLPVSAVKIHW